MKSNSNIIQSNIQDKYKDAVNHYLSPKRKDHVKTKWESPFSRKVIKNTIEKLDHKQSFSSPLQIIDLGCGIGEGFVLIENILSNSDIQFESENIEYLGLDISEKMIKVATKKYITKPNVNFIEADFNKEIPTKPTDIYFSSGVAYSHLTKEEMENTLGKIFEAIKKNQTQSLVFVDVLGRYSIEWVTKWQESRWPYRMSFLADGKQQDYMMMTCYYAPELKTMLEKIATEKGCQITDMEFHDRSIMVGRHTSTLEFNSNISPYRELINSLYESERTTDFQELLFQCPLPESPSPVTLFFEEFFQIWNYLVLKAAEFCGEKLNISFSIVEKTLPESVQGLEQELTKLQENNSKPNFRANILEPTLADYLYRLELDKQKGLGVSHTLIAIAYVDGKN